MKSGILQMSQLLRYIKKSPDKGAIFRPDISDHRKRLGASASLAALTSQQASGISALPLSE